ncbi:MAG TPA: lamin tail domain-containing protein [Myxococcota bacterium]|nr:lamin tail domain-containing protein [Myxococcota bacterium]
MVRKTFYFFSVLMLSVAVSGFLGCAGRSSENDAGHDGGNDGGDGSNDNSISIYAIQNPSEANHPAEDSAVLVKGVIVTTPMDSQTDPDGFWVEEPAGGKYSGVYVFVRGLGVTVSQGDKVDITGTYVENYEQSEIKAATVTVVGSDSLPAPADVSASAVHTGGADAEAYEGVIVRVQNVYVSSAMIPGSDGLDHGDFGVKESGGNDELIVTPTFDFNYDYTRNANDQFNAISGVLEFTFSEFRLSPRGCGDLIDGTDKPVCEVQECPAAGTAVTIAQLQNPGDANHVPAGCQIKVEGAVVSTPIFVTGTDRTQENFYIEDPAGGQWSGVFIKAPAAGSNGVGMGDKVTVEGTVEEYYEKTRIVATSITATGSETVPDPVSVTPVQVNDDGTLNESLEGVLVKMDSVTVTQAVFPGNDSKDHGEFLVALPAEATKQMIVGWDFEYAYSCPPDHTEVCDAATDERDAGDKFTSITGVIDYSFDHFRLQPRMDSDLLVTVDPNDTDGDGVVNASDNCPDVFNPNQENAGDTDAFGDACDNCPAIDNTDQADGDADTVGDACDNCVGLANTDQADLDDDGSGDACDPDVDGDTILDDGDNSGTAGDAPCTGGNAAGCDDNCPTVANTDQADADSNGVGDACEVTYGLIISEVFYNSTGTDDGNEWIELYNGSSQAIDLSTYSIGSGGANYTTSVVQLQGTIQPGGCFVVGGPNVSAASYNPTYDQEFNFTPDFQNAGIQTTDAADGIALFDVTAATITAATVPIDAVIYGAEGASNSSGLLDESGNPGEIDGFAFTAESLERTSTGWRLQTTPSPNDCSHVSQ